MSDLTAWIMARIEEDEAAARAAIATQARPRSPISTPRPTGSTPVGLRAL
jgi:hypothetical protein